MRVRLSYSVELEDVPDSVAELIEGELFRIESAKECMVKALEGLSQEEPHLELVAKSLDKARQTLGSIDLRLNECESILGGYERAISPPEQPQQQMMPPPVPRQPMPAPRQPAPVPTQKNQVPTNAKINPETLAYKYEPKHVIPSAEVEEDEKSIDDELFDGVLYNSPYEVPRESDK